MKKENREFLLQTKNSYLLQRGAFKQLTELDGIFSLIDGHYMGSAEFEWGAIPNSVARMVVNIDFYDFYEVPEIRNSNDEPMIIYGPIIFKEHIIKQAKLLAENKLYTKESTGLPAYLKNEGNYHNADFWWDIENDFYIFFEQPKKELIKQAQINMLEKNKKYLDSGDWDYLSEYYSIVYQDILDQETKEFLRPKKRVLIKRLVKSLNNRKEDLENNHL